MFARTLLAILCLSILCPPGHAQTIDSKTNRILEAPGKMEWVHDMQVILALVGMPGDELRYEEWVRDLDPEFTDWSSTTHSEPFLKYGVRISSSAGPFQEIHPTDDSQVKRFTGDGIGAYVDGKQALGHIPWGPVYFMCHNNAGWHEYKKGIVLDLLPKVGGVNQDNIGGAWKGNIGFCEGCQRVFREFLRLRMTPQEIKALGISNLDKFSIVDYLKKKHKSKLGNHLIDDPLIRQYILAQNLAQQANWRDIADAVHSSEMQHGRAFPITGNQQGGQEWDRPYNLLLSEVNDIVGFESDPWYYNYVHPQITTAGVKFKLALASGRYQKPAWVRGGLYDQKRKAEDGHLFRMRLYGEVFQDLAHGEAFANGGVRVFNLANEGAPGPEPDYEKREYFYQRFIDYADMIHNHRAALQDRENAAEVALAYSMPTQVWESFPPLGIRSTDAFARYAGWARMLEESHLPYEVVIFGHSELFPDGDMLNRLSRYRSIILPGITCMTKAQADAVRKYVDNGGSVIWSGNLATHDENRTPWPEPLLKDFPRLDRQHIGKGRIVGIIDEDRDFRASIAAQESPNPTDFHVMKEAAMWALDGRPQVVSTAGPATQFNLWMAENKRSAGLHLVNYNVDLMRDYVEPQRDIRVSVTLPDALEPIDRVILVAPGEPDIDLPFHRRGDALSFQIPEMRVWAMAVLSSGQEQEAATTLANVRKQIRKHVIKGNDTGDWIARYETAFQQYTQRHYNKALNAARNLIKDAALRQ